jgi:hypothetical protein
MGVRIIKIDRDGDRKTGFKLVGPTTTSEEILALDQWWLPVRARQRNPLAQLLILLPMFLIPDKL